MWWPKTDREKFHVTLAVFVCALSMFGFLAWRMMWRDQIEFTKLPLAYKLTQKRATSLTPLQMSGSEPLMYTDADNTEMDQFVPPRLIDILGSMKQDAHAYNFSGICAMHYNIPVSICYMPRYGREKDVVMFNLVMIGFSVNKTISNEYSMLCSRGQTPYGAERFKWVWIEFWDINGERGVLKVDGMMGRVIQHMAWLNKGVLVCDEWSLQAQADVLFELTNFQANQ